MATSVAALRSTSSREELDDLLDPFERLSSGLVLLEEVPLERLRASVARFAATILRHSERSLATDPPGARTSDPGGASHRLRTEHERFLTSADELLGLLAVVGRDDHGGHRQALGQYGRILVESLRRHRAEERAGGPGRPPAAGTPVASAGNRKEVPREPAGAR
jgi:hypothetical protein